MTSRALLRRVQLPLRAAVAASVAVAIGMLLGLEHPVYAVPGAVIATDLSAAETRRLGWTRLAGTVVGGAFGALLCSVVPSGPVAVGVGVLVAMLLCDVVRVREGAKLGAYICGVVVLAHQASPWSYAVRRMLETMLGVGVAWAVSLVPKLVHLDESGTTGP